MNLRYARCPEGHEVPNEENLRLVKDGQLRMPYDKMIPGYAFLLHFKFKTIQEFFLKWISFCSYGGYQCLTVAPPVCKIKKKFYEWDPYDSMSSYQADFV